MVWSVFLNADPAIGSINKIYGGPHIKGEGGQVNVTMIGLLRHRQTKGTATDRFNLWCGKPAFYSTHSSSGIDRSAVMTPSALRSNPVFIDLTEFIYC
jgi:hypothetical protein